MMVPLRQAVIAVNRTANTQRCLSSSVPNKNKPWWSLELLHKKV